MIQRLKKKQVGELCIATDIKAPNCYQKTVPGVLRNFELMKDLRLNFL